MVVAVHTPTRIVKRSGIEVDFDRTKIESAIRKAFIAVDGVVEDNVIDSLTGRVINVLSVRIQEEAVPSVEKIQDTVVFVLQSECYYEVAQCYIIYRYEHEKKRELEHIPQEVLDAFEEDKKYFKTDLQRLQFYNNYSRFRSDLGRRETWPETVERTVSFLEEIALNKAEKENHVIIRSLLDEVYQAILNMEVTPAMRLMAMAGNAARRDNAVIYNCAYLPIDSVDSFCELMSISLGGSGVGFSVEFENVDKLPRISKIRTDQVIIRHIVEDSSEGWVEALRVGLSVWIQGGDVIFNYNFVRPAGSILKTKGGRSSGPDPLEKLLDFVRNKIRSRQGKKLDTLDCHDIACAIGKAVVSGGVRRTALISIFDEDDEAMLNCKNGDFEKENNQRWCANNSAVWTNVEKMTQQEFVSRMWNTFESERGEPGIFSRENAIKMMPANRAVENTHRKLGINPCGEIVLRPYQFCNLSAAIAREDDTIETLKKKVRLATIIGTIQSCATYFPNLRSIWKVNCDEERLLGVDISGQLDCYGLRNNEYWFDALRDVAVNTNKEVAQLLGINRSAAITCVKPSGNSSVLLDCSSGIHPRWAEYYIRNVRISASSPLVKVLRDADIPLSPENGQDPLAPNTWVVPFPVESPSGAITRKNWTALQQLDWWLKNKLHWTDHNPSATIYYSKNEVLDVMNWLWEHKLLIGGITFLPRDDTKYAQAPYIDTTYTEINKMKMERKAIPFERLWLYEKDDYSTASSTPACEGTFCEL